MAKEPIPTAEYLVPLNWYFLSEGKTIIYQVKSGAMCRIYWQDYDDPDLSESAKKYLHWIITPELKLQAITPWKTESAWYDTGDPVKGWRRDGANFPSYVVSIHDCEKEAYITLRWKPIISQDVKPLLEIAKMAKAHYQNTPTRPDLLPIQYLANLERIAA